MADKKNLNIQEDEMLSEEVRKYPVLHDKSHKGYKEKVAVENAWNEVIKNIEFIENGIFVLLLQIRFLLI